MKKILLALNIMLCCFLFQNSTAQDTKVNSEVALCVAQNEEVAQVLGANFSFVRWQASLDFFTRKTLQRMSAEHTIEIAKLRQETFLVAKLAGNCKYLAKAKKDLDIINKLYENIEITKEDNGFGEEVITQAVANKKLIEKMKKSLDNIRKNYGIKQVYYRTDEIPDDED